MLGFNKAKVGFNNQSSMTSQSSKSSRFYSPAKELLCKHGKRPILQTSSTKDNPGRIFWSCICYEDGCDFFRWAYPKLGGAQQHTEIARNRRKITSLKSRLKDVEWNHRIIVALGIVGWIGFYFCYYRIHIS